MFVDNFQKYCDYRQFFSKNIVSMENFSKILCLSKIFRKYNDYINFFPKILWL